MSVMIRLTPLLVVGCLLLVLDASAQDFSAQTRHPEAMVGISDAYYAAFDDDNPYATTEMLNHIRREKFDLVLPLVMRERGVDMWIHVIRPWTWSGNEHRRLEGMDLNYSNIDSTDSLRYEFGSNAAVLVFTDRGGERIERVVFEGEVVDAGAFDIVNGQSKFINQENYEVMDYVRANPDAVPDTEIGYRFLGLGEFVAERDPETIAVNYAEELSLAEGSETHTLALTDGISFADHLQLSRALGEEYASRMVSAEHMILDYMTRAVMAEVVVFGGSGLPERKRTIDIVPGETRLSDVGSWFSTREADHDEEEMWDYPLQRGDMFQDGQIPYYLLRPGESEPPPEVQRSWDEVVRVRELLAKHIKPGRTGEETLELLIGKLEESGFAYIDRDWFDPSLDPEKTQVHLDLHQVGKGVLAPRISPMGAKWHRDKMIPRFLTLGVEYMVHMPVPEWGQGMHIYYCSLHERAVVTDRGLEFVKPPVSGIQSVN
jgi:CRISPR/Cas system-associated endoribonuclease Cas2